MGAHCWLLVMLLMCDELMTRRHMLPAQCNERIQYIV